jgi:hypothetical protein
MKRYSALVFLAFALSGCVQGFSLVPAGGRAEINKAVTVEPGGQWNKFVQGNNEIWTLDGPALQELRFIGAVADGEQIWPKPTAPLSTPQRDLPDFRATMTPIEISELVVASLEQAGMGNVESKNLRPAKFGTQEGFRFDLAYAPESGLEWQGLAVATIRDKKLYLVLYRAPRIYYFERDRARVEQLISTIQFL